MSIEQVNLAISYDTEMPIESRIPADFISKRTYSKLDMSGKKQAWIDYITKDLWKDPNFMRQSRNELFTIKELGTLFSEFNGKLTSFVLGSWLDVIVEEFGHQKVTEPFSNSAIDIQSHSQNHKPYKTTVKEGALYETQDSSVISNEIKASKDSIKKHLGVDVIGLRTPMGNITPFSEIEDIEILDALKANNIKYVSSWLKSEQKKPNAISLETLPFYYDNGVLEIPGVSSYDVHNTQPTRMLLFNNTESWTEEQRTDYYIGELVNAQTLANHTDKNVFVPWVFHPADVFMYDRNLDVHLDILEFCESHDIGIISYTDIYDIIAKN
ncbi:polysaccharide deacetylase family protein [Candidatus Woesearchaeota archaeon]|nr:polysaccharide deacetylase family protein [Candidatus Woesearchaeota archaeon]MBT7402691.1 polysaccharide deacetylase family protein [Candidatus Woesearchaeota archaeon]